MPVFCISYDLNKTDKNYDGLYDEMKRTGTWAHLLDSTWCVSTQESLADLYYRIRSRMDENDFVFISQLNPNEYVGWLPQEVVDWLRSV